MADWTTIASLGTAAGTLVLAAATFSSVRSGERAARLAEQSAAIAERALLAGMRPVLASARASDPDHTARFADGRFLKAVGGFAAVEREGENWYFVIPLRSVGNGVAVLQGWRLSCEEPHADAPHADPEDHRPQTLDLYVPGGEVAFWQGAVRGSDDPFRAGLDEAVAARSSLSVDLLYGDQEGGQPTISRFILTYQDKERWRASVVRHWVLEGSDPRRLRDSEHNPSTIALP